MLVKWVADFNIQLANDMKIVAYKSEKNKITNTGDKAWTKRVVLYLCGCSAVLIYTDHYLYSFLINKMEGTIVNDEYFGKIPADRLIKENGIIYFKIDGSIVPLGLPASRATDI